MNHTNNVRIFTFLLLFCQLLTVQFVEAYEHSTPKKYELAPYKIHISVTVPFAHQFAEKQCKVLASQISRELQRFSLASIVYEIKIEGGFPSPDPLNNLSIKHLVQPLKQQIYIPAAGAGYDKLISTSVIASNNTYHLHTQEYDAVTDTKSPLVISSTEDLFSLARIISHDITRAFRPLILLTQTKDNKFVASLRAGELGWPEPEYPQIALGDFFTVMHLYQDKNNIVQKRLPANWTYLKVAEQDRGELKLELVSAFRAPVAASRRRVQIVGIQAKPVLEETQLQLLRVTTKTPCPGSVVRVFADKVKSVQPGEQPITPLQTVRTDRYGQTNLKTLTNQKLVYLYPLSGDIVLGTVPFVPGSQSLVTLQVPDDQLRLGVEAQLSQLNAEMIDIVAGRTVILARLKRYAEQEKWSEYDLIRSHIDQLNKADDFRSRLNAIRVFGIEAAQKEKNKTVEKRIITMCKESQLLFDKYFGETDLMTYVKEYDTMREANKKKEQP